MNINDKPLRRLYGGDEIKKRVAELARKIKDWLKGKEAAVCVCVLRGAVFFFADLTRELSDCDVRLDFISISSYGDGVTSGKLRLLSDLRETVEGKNVLVVEDIIDTGYTVKFLREYLAAKGAAECRVACLLDKACNRKTDARADYAAFTLREDKFVVGYGLDAAQKYRNLNGIYVLDNE